ncbi:glycosyltransferase family 61 protein [Pseudoscourfieldia marina]
MFVTSSNLRWLLCTIATLVSLYHAFDLTIYYKLEQTSSRHHTDIPQRLPQEVDYKQLYTTFPEIQQKNRVVRRPIKPTLPSKQQTPVTSSRLEVVATYRCYCGLTELPSVVPKRMKHLSHEISTFWPVGDIKLHNITQVSCIRATRCDIHQAGKYPIALRGYLTSERLRNQKEGFQVHTDLKDARSASKLKLAAQKETFHKEILKDLSLLPLPGNDRIRLASGMVAIENGCVRVDTCREMSIGKMKFRKGQDRCSGFSDQTIANETHCITEARGHNRMRCELKPRSRKLHYSVLWTMSLGPYYSFQHFVIDKLPTILAAYSMLEGNEKAKLLIFMDARGYEILQYLNLDMRHFEIAKRGVDFCADRVWVDAPIPGKYGNTELFNYPRPPEIFLETAKMFQRQRVVRGGNNVTARDKIVFLGRGASGDRGKGPVANLKSLCQILEATPLRLVKLDASRTSIKRLIDVLSQARIVVGVHGGQMANIVFAQADHGTSIIEIAGRQVQFKSYYYGGMSAAYDYHLLPRLCKSHDGTMVHLEDKNQGKCKGPWVADENMLRIALSKIIP